jgi:DNA-binding CsgD family transcriptional regulator
MVALLLLVLGFALGRSARPRTARGDGLSARQREVLGLVSEGLTTKEIAARLRLKDASVRTHIRRARAHLRAPNRAAAVATLLARRSAEPG